MNSFLIRAALIWAIVLVSSDVEESLAVETHAYAMRGSAETRENHELGTEKSNHIATSYVPTGSLSDFVEMNMKKGGENPGASRTEPNKHSSAAVPACGPSPLSAEEVKALVEEAARRHKVDTLLATAITWVESRFDRSRNSNRGARGPMQLTPETAERFGVNDVCDPKANIEGGIKYLRYLLDEFENPLLVAAAYNAGEGRIYEYGGLPPFKETVSYVASVVNYQLGISVPASGGKLKFDRKKSASVTASETETGIIAVKKTGTFVGGVMHF
ncbi:lytic transglycosylase domain-containing protein [Brucella intermedia]|uniref:lytic transglycosylase domain-containing protein n=1 Tax=Brucella intermedia TaxID=94625 RepID=UPI0004685582|nr:lytic transglycosylase domain-containing protein [Brucella intermedia]